MMNKISKIIVVALGLVLGLAACGGGGDGGGTAISTENFQGNWITQDNSLKISINKNGSQFSVIRIMPVTPGLSYTASLNNQILVLNTIINEALAGSADLTLTSSSTIKAVVTSCSPPLGYSCAPIGTEVFLYKEL